MRLDVPMKSEVQFKSTAFNCTEPRGYFINEGCFGDDVARFLMNALRSQGLEVGEEPGQEDFGWYFSFQVDGVPHSFVIGFQPNDPVTGNRWLGWLEHHTGFFSSLFGGRKGGILPGAVEAIDTALKSSPAITHIVWHEQGTDGEME